MLNEIYSENSGPILLPNDVKDWIACSLARKESGMCSKLQAKEVQRSIGVSLPKATGEFYTLLYFHHHRQYLANVAKIKATSLKFLLLTAWKSN